MSELLFVGVVGYTNEQRRVRLTHAPALTFKVIEALQSYE